MKKLLVLLSLIVVVYLNQPFPGAEPVKWDPPGRVVEVISWKFVGERIKTVNFNLWVRVEKNGVWYNIPMTNVSTWYTTE